MSWWVVLVLALLPGARARATEPVELVWTARAGCPGAQQVLERVRKLAGPMPEATQLRAEARIERTSEGLLRLQLITHVGALTGERVLEGKSCEDLANTVAIHLALLLQGTEPLRAQPVSLQPVAAEVAPAQAPAAVSGERTSPTVAQEVTPADPPRRLFGLLQVPLVLVSMGPLPRISPGLALAGGVQLERVRLLLEGRVWLGQRLSPEREPTLGADLDRVSLSLRACRAIGTGPWELAPCALVGLELLWARGSGSHLAARTAQATWVHAGLGAQIRYALAPWFGIVARVDALLELSRPRITVDGLGTIGQLGPAAVSLGLGAEWIL